MKWRCGVTPIDFCRRRRRRRTVVVVVVISTAGVWWYCNSYFHRTAPHRTCSVGVGVGVRCFCGTTYLVAIVRLYNMLQWRYLLLLLLLLFFVDVVGGKSSRVNSSIFSIQFFLFCFVFFCFAFIWFELNVINVVVVVVVVRCCWIQWGWYCIRLWRAVGTGVQEWHILPDFIRCCRRNWPNEVTVMTYVYTGGRRCFDGFSK